ncbi:MAG TPA: amidohydrolase family protein, partial [Bryobacteraceae bacterium]|nr:amidohydrolase family protein [Bryobacteraceae bacterium]
MSFLLIDGGRVWPGTPTGEGPQSFLIAGERIARAGPVNRGALDLLGVEYETIDASGCLIMPGLIDVHEHLLGGSGEQGFETQTPEIFLSELLSAGITTVVGCLGTDTTTKTMQGLLAKAKALKNQGLTSFVWSGGYNVPPVTLTGSIRTDMLFVDEIIGSGETAIADKRSTAPSLAELARLVKETYVAGTLSGKAGVTHFHVGEEPHGLADLRELLDNYGAKPEWLYPTHVERNESLMTEAVELTKRGVTVDVDTIEEDLAQWLRFFLNAGGDPGHLTASSDAAISSPQTLFRQIRSCVLDARFDRDVVLPLVTANPARVLKLSRKGRLEPGCDADLL